MSRNTAQERSRSEESPRPRAPSRPVERRVETLDLAPDTGAGALRATVSLVGPEGAPVVAALGGISATHRTCDDGADAGWWREIAGEGRALDTRRWRILGWTWPALAGRTLTTRDHAHALAAVLDRLGVARLHALVGASYGGMVGLAFAQAYPERLRALVAVSAAHRSDPLATAWRAIQRRIVRFGLAHGAGRDALVLARALAMTSYRTRDELALRFSGPPAAGPEGASFPVERYLFARGEDYAKQTAPERFLALSEALDLHELEPARVAVPAHFVAVRRDQLVPLELMRELARDYGGPCRLHEIDSLYGHDAFLKEAALLGPILSAACGSESDV
jgi:homoserine O-acetyltransferase